eukprot:TRINITY_DN32536_c0_g1_i1.p1 TRINITY_DN32536_c0_g1~~TRINITY_DN32536_c0_g1_i1.p1  ORF type:complete len:665 (-),score=81.80 TRINITY_DN32536_c0_g1_i1:1672-3666(-)
MTSQIPAEDTDCEPESIRCVEIGTPGSFEWRAHFSSPAGPMSPLDDISLTSQTPGALSGAPPGVPAAKVSDQLQSPSDPNSPWLLNAVCMTPARTWLQVEVAEDEPPFHPLRLRRPRRIPQPDIAPPQKTRFPDMKKFPDVTSSEKADMSASSELGSSRATDASSTPLHYADNCPWNLAFLPETASVYGNGTKEEARKGVLQESLSKSSRTNVRSPPLQVVEISAQANRTIGEVYEVKPLGAFAVVNGGELSWTVIAIASADPMERVLNGVEDVNKWLPGLFAQIREWLRKCMCVDKGSKEAGFLLNEEVVGVKQSQVTILRAHRAWEACRKARTTEPAIALLPALAPTALYGLTPSGPSGTSVVPMRNPQRQSLSDDVLQCGGATFTISSDTFTVEEETDDESDDALTPIQFQSSARQPHSNSTPGTEHDGSLAGSGGSGSSSGSTRSRPNSSSSKSPKSSKSSSSTFSGSSMSAFSSRSSTLHAAQHSRKKSDEAAGKQVGRRAISSSDPWTVDVISDVQFPRASAEWHGMETVVERSADRPHRSSLSSRPSLLSRQSTSTEERTPAKPAASSFRLLPFGQGGDLKSLFRSSSEKSETAPRKGKEHAQVQRSRKLLSLARGSGDGDLDASSLRRTESSTRSFLGLAFGYKSHPRASTADLGT